MLQIVGEIRITELKGDGKKAENRSGDCSALILAAEKIKEYWKSFKLASSSLDRSSPAENLQLSRLRLLRIRC